METSSHNVCELFASAEHEHVVLWSDPNSAYRGIIAVHSTALGPALGGTRFRNYENDRAASVDALRLSRAMSYKNALAEIPFGGGKAVIIGNADTCNREQTFRAHGRFVESLGGMFITGEDVGTRPSDMNYVSQETRFVAGLPGRSGDPSPMTARGVFRSLQACARHRWGCDSMAGRTVAIQGCGSTGYHLAREVQRAGAKVIATDVNPAALERVVQDFAAAPVSPEDIFAVAADVFAPCALGGILNDETIRQLKVEIVVGSANNQLLDDAQGEALAQLEILYAPDFVANAGGVINGCRELLGWDEPAAVNKVDKLYDRMTNVLQTAAAKGEPPFKVANQMAQALIAAKQSARSVSESTQ
jgi:leucine dehydrogenase